MSPIILSHAWAPIAGVAAAIACQAVADLPHRYVVTLLEHPNRCTEYSRQAIDRVRQHLSVNRLIDATEAAYQRVVDTPRAADSPGPPSAD